MEGFLISCTTCRTRLKVRDTRLLGQILPCPKCGSMVLIDSRTLSSTEAETVDRAGASAGTPATRPHSVRNDSFDNIDQLLEEPYRLPSAAAAERWRMTGSPANRSQEEVAPEDGATTGEAQVGQDAEIDSREIVGDGWASRSAALRSYFLIGGGALAGLTLAVGFMGWLTSRPSSSAISATVAADPPAASAPGEVKEPSADVAVEPAADRLDPLAAKPPSNIEVTADDIAPGTAESIPDASAIVAARPDDVPVAVAADDQAPPPDVPPPPPPEGRLPGDADGGRISNGSGTAAPPADDLAAFAQWLQDPDAIPATPTPSPTAPTTSSEPPAAADELPDEPWDIQPTRPLPTPVDVAARLEEPISAIQLREVPLWEALRLVTQISTIPIRLHPDALGRRNLRADHAVSLTLRDETIRGLLDAILAPTGLGWLDVDGQLIVTTEREARGDPVTIGHDVSDLTKGDPEATAALAVWITQLIESESWVDPEQGDSELQGGRLHVDQSTLVVTHRDTVHYQILEFCEKLRVARGLGPRTRILRDRISLAARTASCKALDASVSLRLWQDRNINQIAAELGRQGGVQILVDWPALFVAGWSPQDAEKLFVEDRPLREMLVAWLRPKGLSFRVVDSQTLEISTPQAIAATHDVEVYRLTDNPSSSRDWRTLGRELLARLGEDKFQPQGRGAVAYDEASGSLVVSLPQPEQGVVARLIRP